MCKNEHDNNLESQITENLLSELNALFDNADLEQANFNADNTLALNEDGHQVEYEVVNIFAYKEDLFAVLLPVHMHNSFSPNDFVIKRVEDSPYESPNDDFLSESDNKSIDELFEELKKDFEAGFSFPDLDDNEEKCGSAVCSKRMF